MVRNPLQKIFKKRKHRDLAGLVLGFILLVLVNYIASIRFSRLDMTSEKRYSLSDSTKKMLRELDDVVLFKVYLEGDLSAKYKKLRNSIREMLDEFNYYSKGNIEYQFINPFADPDKKVQRELEEELVRGGIYPTTDTEVDDNSMTRKNIYPGAFATHGEKMVAISFLKSTFVETDDYQINLSIQNLEYEIISAIYRLTKTGDRKKIAFSYGHGELEDRYIADMLYELRDFYDLERVEIRNDLNILNQSHDVLVVAKPDSVFNDASRFVLDQYIMNGGRVLWLIDQARTPLDSLMKSNYTMAYSRPLNLHDMLFKYGVKLNDDIILDAQCAPITINVGQQGNQPRYELFPWYYMPVLVQDSAKNLLVKNTDGLRLEIAGSLDTTKVRDVEKTILLTTSKLSRSVRPPTRVALDIIEQKPTPEFFDKSHLPVAVLLEGTFSSIYENRLAELSDRKVLTRSQPTKMIVVSDGDIIRNRFSEKSGPLALGFDPMTKIYYPGNKTFLLNSINYLADDGWFVPLRAKVFKSRLLDKTKVRNQADFVKTVNIVAPIAFVVVFGLIYNFLRKRKYAS